MEEVRHSRYIGRLSKWNGGEIELFSLVFGLK